MRANPKTKTGYPEQDHQLLPSNWQARQFTSMSPKLCSGKTQSVKCKKRNKSAHWSSRRDRKVWQLENQTLIPIWPRSNLVKYIVSRGKTQPVKGKPDTSVKWPDIMENIQPKDNCSLLWKNPACKKETCNLEESLRSFRFSPKQITRQNTSIVPLV